MTVKKTIALVQDRPWFFFVDSATSLKFFLTGLVASGEVYSIYKKDLSELRKIALFPQWYAEKANIPIDKWADHVELTSMNKWDSIQIAGAKISSFLGMDDANILESLPSMPSNLSTATSFKEFWATFRNDWGLVRISEVFAFFSGFTLSNGEFLSAKRDDQTLISLNPNSSFTSFARTKIGVDSNDSLYGILIGLHGNSPSSVKRLFDLVTEYLNRQ